MRVVLSSVIVASLVITLPLGVYAQTQPTATPENTKPVTTAQVGALAPDFSLTSTAGAQVKLSDFRGKTVVLEWFNPDCPFVKVAHGEGKVGSQAVAHVKSGGVWIAINSGGPGLQGHGLERNQEAAKTYKLSYPLLLDETGAVGKAYGAKRTPHMFVINPEGTLVYQGARDSSGGGGYDRGPVQAFVSDALTATRDGKAVKIAESKAWGCSVKYAR